MRSRTMNPKATVAVAVLVLALAPAAEPVPPLETLLMPRRRRHVEAPARGRVPSVGLSAKGRLPSWPKITASVILVRPRKGSLAIGL